MWMATKKSISKLGEQENIKKLLFYWMSDDWVSNLDFADAWARFLRWVTRNQELKKLRGTKAVNVARWVSAELMLPWVQCWHYSESSAMVHMRVGEALQWVEGCELRMVDNSVESWCACEVLCVGSTRNLTCCVAALRWVECNCWLFVLACLVCLMKLDQRRICGSRLGHHYRNMNCWVL